MQKNVDLKNFILRIFVAKCWDLKRRLSLYTVIYLPAAVSFDIGKQDEVKTKKIFNVIADRCRPWRQVQKNFYLSTSIKLERQIHIFLFKNVANL